MILLQVCTNIVISEFFNRGKISVDFKTQLSKKTNFIQKSVKNVHLNPAGYHSVFFSVFLFLVVLKKFSRALQTACDYR